MGMELLYLRPIYSPDTLYTQKEKGYDIKYKLVPVVDNSDANHGNK